MGTYAIGDVQGCFKELKMLLNHINFDAKKDTLWLAGDLVNRGSYNVEVLRFVKNLGNRHKVVLGNHDLHLLAVAKHCRSIRPKDTFQDVLNAPDKDELLNWLRYQHLLLYDDKLNVVMAHAGILPQWHLTQAREYAKEVENVLHSHHYVKLLQHLYKHTPALWHDALQSYDRYRFIVNVFTRMRYCDQVGGLNFTAKGAIGTQDKNLLPWFCHPQRKITNVNVVFGHWATLRGVTNQARVFAIDTGCAWGHELTALCLENLQRFTVKKIPPC